jgi:hypothetical protein
LAAVNNNFTLSFAEIRSDLHLEVRIRVGFMSQITFNCCAATPIVIQRLNEKSTGGGGEVLGPPAAAIANALFDATGVRLREFPMTPARVLAALKSG